MLISIRNGLVYIYLQHKDAISQPSDSFPDADGYFLYDRASNWVGVRIRRTLLEEGPVMPIGVPKIKRLDYMLLPGSIEETKTQLEIKFHAETEVYSTREQSCVLDLNEHGIYGIEMVMDTTVTSGAACFVERFLDRPYF
ncbi:hypothetical protein B0H94_11011 [Salsuginibacillus halophilus]|uniref:Uncharacterized protein n=1 Tax=Salsuginibacillus halophilus TaxID=517424 RepID=A0A2P8HBE3_9BACI|nr:hypothetical protein [Salsuginibacillus halophilus]PSL43536.1 hypothetical protein B0H94_11011 [Salsuginibacillus halophilus]